MPAYVICHVQQQNAPRGDKARELLSHSIAGLWNGTLHFDSTWIVEAQKTSDEIRDELVDCLGERDGLLVIRASIDAAWAGFKPVDCDWLVEHLLWREPRPLVGAPRSRIRSGGCRR